MEKHYTKITDGLTQNTSKLEPRRNLGAGGELKTLPVAHLYIDTRYQRTVSSRGYSNIRHMIENFYWSQFQPIVVAKISASKYAVIDGQHRAHACALHPEIDFIPALVLDIPVEEQARSFAAINGRVTKVKPLDIYWAGVQGQDEKWLAVKQACDRAGVAVFRKVPSAALDRPDGFTAAVKAVANVVDRFDEDVAANALKAIMQAWDGFYDELMTGPITLMSLYVAVWGPLDEAAIKRLSETSAYEILKNVPTVLGSAKYPRALQALERHMRKQEVSNAA